MSSHQEEWMKPEQALSRFKRKAIEIESRDSIDKELSTRYGYIVKDIGFMISENTLCEVVKSPEIYPLPNTKQWLCGLVNVRGNLVPVFDFARLISLASESTSHENLLILGSGEKAIGILIDSVPRVCEMAEFKKINKINSEMNGLEDFVESTYMNDETGMIWMDINERKYFESVKNDVAV